MFSLLGLLSISGQANAAMMTFTDSTSFFAALPSPSFTQDFEGVPAGTAIPDGSTLDGILYSSNVSGANLFVRTTLKIFSKLLQSNITLGDNFLYWLSA